MEAHSPNRSESKGLRRALRRRFVPAALALALLALAPRPGWCLFEDLPPSARARAMGAALTSYADDAWAGYYNPAMLPRMPLFEAGVATAQPYGLGFNRLTTVGVASPLQRRIGGLSFGWRHYTVENGSVDLLRENTLSFSHGFMLFGDASTSASFGWTLNLYHAEFASTVGTGDGSDGFSPGSAWAVGVDIAAVVTVFERTYVGFSTRNLNAPTIGDDAEELRRQVNLGISYRPYPGVTTALDVSSGQGENLRILGGLEFEIVPQFELRFGLETQPNKVNGGFSVNLPKVTFDYGFGTGGGVLDTTHQFGVRTRLDLLGETEP